MKSKGPHIKSLKGPIGYIAVSQWTRTGHANFNEVNEYE